MVSKREGNMEKKLDLRVQKTYKALLGALYQLLCEKSFDAITVTELCDRAETRKATFYKHFGDKTELFSYMIKEMQQRALEEKKVQYDPAAPQSYYIGAFRYFLEFLDGNEQFIRKILSSSGRSTLIDLLSAQMEYDLKQHLKEDIARNASFPAQADLLASAYTGAMVYCGQWWITQPDRPAKEVVIAQFTELLTRLY